MKLITKNSIIFLLVTLAVFCVGTYIFYIQLKDIIDEEATEEVMQLKEDVAEFIKKNQRFPESVNPLNIILIDRVNAIGKERMRDTLREVETFGEILPFKESIFYVASNERNYQVIVGKAMFEADDLIETIVRSFIILAGVLIVILITVNFLYSKFIWRPFFRTLKQLSNYDIQRDGTIPYQKSTTTEFNRFSEEVNKMTTKLVADYQNLKSFTENASHELQTPITIMITKTEDLLQSEKLSKEEREKIYQLNQSALRLKKLNQTLLLLSKIENDQFKVIRETNFSERLKIKLDQLEDLIKIKDLKLETHIEEKVEQTMDPVLVDAVISNLLGNAIKYTSESGKLIVKLHQDAFTVSNSGIPLNVDGERLFERFFKINSDSDSSGLGLALVKQIANTHGHHVNYDHQGDLHVFEYKF